MDNEQIAQTGRMKENLEVTSQGLQYPFQNFQAKADGARHQILNGRGGLAVMFSRLLQW